MAFSAFYLLEFAKCFDIYDFKNASAIKCDECPSVCVNTQKTKLIYLLK